MYVVGSPCHLTHITASSARGEFANWITGISAEELLVDLYK